MALALYRTYRPGQLSDVIGQEHVTVPLGRALDAGRAHHAYLFTGPRGCGKTSTARIMARSLCCEQGPTATPCGTCQFCIELAPNGPGSLDVIELDAASHRGIDEARDLRERAAFAPAAARYKVYIIDEAHQLTDAAAQALLKLIEEPPPHLRFIFATTEPDRILPTIKSRTHHYPFRLVPMRRLQEHLAWVCEQEGVVADSAALAVVARAGAGSVRDALSVLGQVVAGSGPDGVTYDDVISQLGVTDQTLIDDMIMAISDRDGAGMFRLIDKVMEGGLEPRRFATDLLERLRDVVVLTHVPDAIDTGLLVVPDGVGAAMTRQAAALGPVRASRAADLVSDGISDLRGATAPRLQLELLCARLLVPGADDSEAGVLARLVELERTVAGIATGAPTRSFSKAPTSDTTAATPKTATAVPAIAAESAPEPKARSAQRSRSTATPAVAPPPPPLSSVGVPSPALATEEASPATPAVDSALTTMDLAGVRSMWPAVLEALKASSRVAWTAFEQSAPVSISDSTLAVALADQGKVAFARQGGRDERLRQAILDVLRADFKIDILLDPERATRTTTPKVLAETQGASDDDETVTTKKGVALVTDMLGGTIVETRQGDA